ncbi:uncharacterized protein EAF01_007253 [Botrytis porri]|uniref:Uncharacterized protein n=1 Tax=Botrytis porri TaxID=87229 RepID=A0A4Z1KMA5_9HELO|nr:uncharacterized protein EAF01_007253 [Botrytis porri]KAF7901955.1 hypothetical protein EAF01_007253 [Botrytis porri]TGO85432.1 hypothetical protein BPOR_0396g00040 [Botrytis porri]
MTSPKSTLKSKAKAPASISHLAAAPLSAPSSTPIGTMPLTKESAIIRLQPKSKRAASPTRSEDAPVDTSSSMPTETIPPTKKSTKIRLQLKNKRPGSPAPSEGTPISSSSSSTPTGTMSLTKRSTEIDNLLKRTAVKRPFTWPRPPPYIYDRDSTRPHRMTRTEAPLEPELQGHGNEGLLGE